MYRVRGHPRLREVRRHRPEQPGRHRRAALDVGLAILAGDTETADISSAAGDQLVTGPADPDVTTAIGSITQLNIGQLSAKSTADGTNFASGLQAAAVR